MRINILIIISLIVLSACSNDRQKAKKTITALEKQVEETPDPAKVSGLIRQYMLYRANYPQDRELNSKFLYRTAALRLRQDQPNEATGSLIEAIKYYPGTSNTLNNALLLAAIYKDELNDPISSTTIYQVLQETHPNEKSVQEKALRADTPSLEVRLADMQRKVFADSLGNFDLETAIYFIHSCELLAFLKPGDLEGAKWLSQAAETARAIKRNPKALQIYDWIYTRYPDYERAPQALFLKGFILDEDLNRKEEARAVYELFLERYPDNDFADDAQFLLDNLNKNEEEIINQFQDREK
jgi:tetratricopeptide (TPR) repeat protein